jgi:hypothetical protein
MYPLKYLTNLYLLNEITMEYLELFKATELAERLGVHRKRIPADRWLYIPVRVSAGSSKKYKQGFSVRYIAVKDIKNYLRTKCNRKPEVKHKTNSYKWEKKARQTK